MSKPRQRAGKWEVYGEFGDKFTNLVDAKNVQKNRQNSEVMVKFI